MDQKSTFDLQNKSLTKNRRKIDPKHQKSNFWLKKKKKILTLNGKKNLKFVALIGYLLRLLIG